MPDGAALRDQVGAFLVIEVPASQRVPAPPETGAVDRVDSGGTASAAAVQRTVAILEHVEVEGVDHRLLAREVEIDRPDGDRRLARDGGHRCVAQPKRAMSRSAAARIASRFSRFGFAAAVRLQPWRAFLDPVP